MPVTMIAFFIGSMSIIGLPPCGGSWSKWFLVVGAADTGKWVIIATLMLSSLLNIAYLMPIPLRAFFCKPSSPHPDHQTINEAPLPAVLALSITAIGCIVLFFYTQPLYRLALAFLESSGVHYGG